MVLLSVRLLSARLNIIHDCDEVLQLCRPSASVVIDSCVTCSLTCGAAVLTSCLRYGFHHELLLQVYNYWEPLHFILYGSGMQTWEYR